MANPMALGQFSPVTALPNSGTTTAVTSGQATGVGGQSPPTGGVPKMNTGPNADQFKPPVNGFGKRQRNQLPKSPAEKPNPPKPEGDNKTDSKTMMKGPQGSPGPSQTPQLTPIPSEKLPGPSGPPATEGSKPIPGQPNGGGSSPAIPNNPNTTNPSQGQQNNNQSMPEAA